MEGPSGLTANDPGRFGGGGGGRIGVTSGSVLPSFRQLPRGRAGRPDVPSRERLGTRGPEAVCGSARSSKRALCGASPPRSPLQRWIAKHRASWSKSLIRRTGKAPSRSAKRAGIYPTHSFPFCVLCPVTLSPLDIVHPPSPRPCCSPPNSALPCSFPVHVALSTRPGVRRHVIKILLLCDFT